MLLSQLGDYDASREKEMAGQPARNILLYLLLLLLLSLIKLSCTRNIPPLPLRRQLARRRCSFVRSSFTSFICRQAGAPRQYDVYLRYLQYIFLVVVVRAEARAVKFVVDFW